MFRCQSPSNELPPHKPYDRRLEFINDPENIQAAYASSQGLLNFDQLSPLKLCTGTLASSDRTLDNPDSHLTSKTCLIGASEKTHSVQSMLDTGASEEAFLDQDFTHSHLIPLNPPSRVPRTPRLRRPPSNYRSRNSHRRRIISTYTGTQNTYPRSFTLPNFQAGTSLSGFL